MAVKLSSSPALKMMDINTRTSAAASPLATSSSSSWPCSKDGGEDLTGNNKENQGARSPTEKALGSATELVTSSPSITPTACSVEPAGVRRKKISGYIHDKALRTRSYVRRRPIPFKRVIELDNLCGTKSFTLQVCRDFEEVIYWGSPDLVRCFLSPSGLKISDVNSLLVAGRYQARPRGTPHNWEHDYNPMPNSDDEAGHTIDSAQPLQDTSDNTTAKKSSAIDFIANPGERFKRFKSLKDGVFAKLKEIDTVCGVSSMAVIVNLERECAHYYGPDHLVSQLFTNGLVNSVLLESFNVREFCLDEIENNVCCVPHCLVSRNTLSRWRSAAIQLYGFPVQLPFNLNLCAEEEKDKWIAEIDLDPSFKARVAVCSFHFKDGYPTTENPYPTEMLTETTEPSFFRGKIPSLDPPPLTSEEAVHNYCRSLLENLVLRKVDKHIDTMEAKIQLEAKLKKERIERRKRELQSLKSIKFYKFSSLKRLTKKKTAKRSGKSRKICHRPGAAYQPSFRRRLNRSTSLKCKFCSQTFSYTKALFQHTRSVHILPVMTKKERTVDISNSERRQVMSRLYPAQNRSSLDPRKKYVCAVCKSVFDLVGLFLHMKEVHHGLLCQYCLKLFKKVKDLDYHLGSVHHQRVRYYHSIDLFKLYSGHMYTMACSECSAIVSVEEVQDHTCARVQFDCPWCRQNFSSQEELEGHIVNNWCPQLKIFEGNPGLREIQVVYKILTGKLLQIPEEEEEAHSIEMMDTEINTLLEVGIGSTDSELKAKSATEPKKNVFSCFDKANINKILNNSRALKKPTVLLEDIPVIGTIFSGSKSKGITNNIKKEFKDRGRTYDILKEIAANGKEDIKLDEAMKEMSIQKAGKNFIIDVSKKSSLNGDVSLLDTDLAEHSAGTPIRLSKRLARQPVVGHTINIGDPQPAETKPAPDSKKEKPKQETRTERIIRLEFEIKENMKKMRQLLDTFTSCLFCQQCKTVSVDAQFLLSHFHIIHSDNGVDSFLGENTQHCIARIKRHLRDIKKKEMLFNYMPPEEIFILEFYRCSYCPTSECRVYEDLFKHTAEAHNTKVLTCNICHNIFLNYGSLISHVCSGPPTSSTARARFACKVCHRIDLSSFLDFQTHIRKEHNTCEICFQPQACQKSLYEHCASHDQDLMCMKCFVTFEKADSFRKHMFWKHSSEQSECKICHSPTWPHVYHFCLPNMPVPCHTCDHILPNSAAFKVHNRQHVGSTPHTCDQKNCNKSFISKSLLWKHQYRRHPSLKDSVSKLLYERKLRKEIGKYGTESIESLDVVYRIMGDIWESVSGEIERLAPAIPPKSPDLDVTPEKKESVLDAAIRSIMPESEEDAAKGEATVSTALPDQDRDAIQASIANRSYTEDNSWQAGIDALLAGASVSSPSVSEHLQDQNDERGSNQSEDEEAASRAPVMSGLWNQDLMFVNHEGSSGHREMGNALSSRGKVRETTASPYRSGGGPRLRGGFTGRQIKSTNANVQAEFSNQSKAPKTKFNLNLSESSEDEDEQLERKMSFAEARKNLMFASRTLLDHDYCYAAFMLSQEPVRDTEEMDKIVSNVSFDGFGDGYEQTYISMGEEAVKKRLRKKKKKDKKRKKKKRKEGVSDESSESSDMEKDTDKVDVFGIQARHNLQFANTPSVPAPDASRKAKTLKIKSPVTSLQTPLLKRGPKPKYHTPDVAKTAGVTAGTARPSFDTDSSSHNESDADRAISVSGEETLLTDDEIRSSDLDTDFSADEVGQTLKEARFKPAAIGKAANKPALKLKIKLPPNQKESKVRRRKRKFSLGLNQEREAKPLSKKMRESLALNQRPASSEEDHFEESNEETEVGEPGVNALQESTEDVKLYCYCQCPHDDISEMIGCDAPDCKLEWFHFECVGIMVPPAGKWYCPQCTKRYGLE